MIKKTGEILRKRNLFVLYCMEADMYLEDEYIKDNRKKLYVFFGCTLEGKKKYVTSIFEDEVVKTSEWYEFLQRLKGRGIEKIIFALLPSIKELKDAMNLSFKEVEIFESCDRTIKKLNKYNSFKTNSELYKQVKKLYLAKDLLEYELNYEEFINKYSEYGFIMDMLNEQIKALRSNYKYSSKIRRIIYAFNYIIEMEKRFHILCNEKIYKDKEEFIDDCSWFIYQSELAVHYKREEWVEVLNEIYESKRNLIQPYL